jgi:hypothetical protein
MVAPAATMSSPMIGRPALKRLSQQLARDETG